MFRNKDPCNSITRVEMVPITAVRLILINVPVIPFEAALHGLHTFQWAAISLGLVEDKKECLLCFREACLCSTPAQLRSLFVLLTIQGFPTHFIFDEPTNLNLKQMMYPDFLMHNNHNDNFAYNQLLNDLSHRLLEENHTLSDYGFPEPDIITTDLQRERMKYNTDEQLHIFNNLNATHPNTPEQQEIFDDVTSGLQQKLTQIIFIQGKCGRQDYFS